MVVQTASKKPVTIQFVQFNGKNYQEVIEFAKSAYLHPDGSLIIKTLEGNMTVSNGDMVIRGIQGEFYPCKPDIFNATYNID